MRPQLFIYFSRWLRDSTITEVLDERYRSWTLNEIQITFFKSPNTHRYDRVCSDWEAQSLVSDVSKLFAWEHFERSNAYNIFPFFKFSEIDRFHRHWKNSYWKCITLISINDNNLYPVGIPIIIFSISFNKVSKDT